MRIGVIVINGIKGDVCFHNEYICHHRIATILVTCSILFIEVT